MHDRDRFKLIRPYSTPRFKYGDVVVCELRGEVKIVGLSNGRIPWPKCRSGKRARAIILYGALADAVRMESAQAVGYWWGVGSYTVWQWRKALGVPSVNAGTQRLKRDYADEPWFSAAQRKAHAKARDPIRRAKIAAARRGKPRPPHVHAAMRAGKLGWHPSEVTRQRMSWAHRQRGTWPPSAGRPWTKAEDAAVRKMTQQSAAKRTRLCR